MLRGGLSRLGLALGLLAGCSRPAAPRYVERVTSDEQGVVWLTGSDGYAARVGGGTRGQIDYPILGKSPDVAYGHAPVAASRVVVRRGVPFLFTRPGEVYTWGPGGWARLPMHFTSSSVPEVQVDEVLLTPQDEWIVHLHTTTLLRASHENLLASRFATEQIPTYVTWLGLLGGSLYGLGWEGSTERRTVYKLVGGRWQIFPTGLVKVHGMIRTPQDEIAVVTDDSLVVIEQEGQQTTPRTRKLLAEGSYFQEPIAIGARTLITVIGREAGLVELLPAGPQIWRFPGATSSIVGGYATGAGTGAVLMTGELLPPRVSRAARRGHQGNRPINGVLRCLPRPSSGAVRISRPWRRRRSTP